MSNYLKRLSDKFFPLGYEEPPAIVGGAGLSAPNGRDLFLYRNSLYFADEQVRKLSSKLVIFSILIMGTLFPLALIANQALSKTTMLFCTFVLALLIIFGLVARTFWLGQKVKAGAKIYKKFEPKELNLILTSQAVLKNPIPTWIALILPLVSVFLFILFVLYFLRLVSNPQYYALYLDPVVAFVFFWFQFGVQIGLCVYGLSERPMKNRFCQMKRTIQMKPLSY